jgi:hypothetical protein
MEKFNIKSIVLGIGIGIVITSLISIIYLAGRDPKSLLSDEEIIMQAEKLGMVKAESMVKKSDMQGQNKDNTVVKRN